MEEDDFHVQDEPSGHSEDTETKPTTLDTAFSDTERRAGSNVISVIQHTNSLNRLNSSEKSSDARSYPYTKLAFTDSWKRSIAWRVTEQKEQTGNGDAVVFCTRNFIRVSSQHLNLVSKFQRLE